MKVVETIIMQRRDSASSFPEKNSSTSALTEFGREVPAYAMASRLMCNSRAIARILETESRLIR